MSGCFVCRLNVLVFCFVELAVCTLFSCLAFTSTLFNTFIWKAASNYSKYFLSVSFCNPFSLLIVLYENLLPERLATANRTDINY